MSSLTFCIFLSLIRTFKALRIIINYKCDVPSFYLKKGRERNTSLTSTFLYFSNIPNDTLLFFLFFLFLHISIFSYL